jgi:hypothetical protein
MTVQGQISETEDTEGIPLTVGKIVDTTHEEANAASETGLQEELPQDNPPEEVADINPHQGDQSESDEVDNKNG